MQEFLSDTETAWRSIHGHRAACNLLSQAHAKNTIPHALLFSGPSGVGKRAVARAFASLIFRGLLPADSELRVQTERMLADGSHPDLHLVGRSEDKKNIGVEDIRTLCAALRLRPYYGGCHVAILDDAHEMNSSAYNALLMTLEEPPPRCYLILISEAPQRLPATIISRCQPVHFGELSEDELRAVLRKLLPSLGDEQLATLSQFAGGSMEALDLGGFIHPHTLLPNDSEALQRHLDGICQESVRVSRRIRELFHSERGREPAYVAACIAAQDLGSEKDSSALVWRLILQELRHVVRAKSETTDQRSEWAALLETTIRSMALTKERNLNLPLQLTNIFAKAAEIAVS